MFCVTLLDGEQKNMNEPCAFHDLPAQSSFILPPFGCECTKLSTSFFRRGEEVNTRINGTGELTYVEAGELVTPLGEITDPRLDPVIYFMRSWGF